MKLSIYRFRGCHVIEKGKLQLTPITQEEVDPVETKPLDSVREYLPSSGRIITGEEYGAIMSEVANMEAGLKDGEKPMQVEKRVRKLEFYMLILIGCVLVFFLLSRTG